MLLATLTEGGLSLDVSLQLLSADFDGNGTVNNLDLGIWSSNYGQALGAAQTSGDADGDGDVDGLDFLIWQRQFGMSSGTGVASVPEPASLFLMITTLILGLGRSRLVKCNRLAKYADQ